MKDMYAWRPRSAVDATPMILETVIGELFQTVIGDADKATQTLVKLFERNAGMALAPQK